MRRIAMVFLLVALLLAAQRLLVPFPVQTASRFDGEDILPVYTTCGRAAHILLDGAAEMPDLGPALRSNCTRAARTRALEAGGAVLIALASVWLVRSRWVRGVEPIDNVLRPLPKTTSVVRGRTGRTMSHPPNDSG